MNIYKIGNATHFVLKGKNRVEVPTNHPRERDNTIANLDLFPKDFFLRAGLWTILYNIVDMTTLVYLLIMLVE